MNARDEMLRQFFGGYFHQDWDVEGAESWQDVVKQFVMENPASHVRDVRDALRSWLRDTEASPLKHLPADYGCDYTARSDGFSDREWVERLAEALDEQAGTSRA